MTAEPDSELVRRILSGADANLTELAAQGILPLSAEELLYVQVRLATSPDGAIASLARQTLEARPVEELSTLLDETPPLVAAYFAEYAASSVLQRQAIARRGLEPEVLVRIARTASPEAQEALLQRQDLIIAEPAILDALETNPRVGTFARRRIGEYRRHLLRPEPETEPAPDTQQQEPYVALVDLDSAELSQLSEAELLARIIADVALVPQEGEVDEYTGLSEGQLRLLSPGLRMRLVHSAGRGLRLMLLLDPNKQVALSVLESGRMSEAEIEMAAANRKVCEDVIVRIANKREWVQKYRIVAALVRNPRTPVGLALRFLSRLSVKDLALLRTDRGVSDAVRKNADRMFKTKVN